jgi:hypothetical protein
MGGGGALLEHWMSSTLPMGGMHFPASCAVKLSNAVIIFEITARALRGALSLPVLSVATRIACLSEPIEDPRLRVKESQIIY